MPQFFVKSSKITGSKCTIDGEDYYHLRRVRRVKPGDFIDLRAGDGSICKGIISEINPSSIIAEIVDIAVNKDKEISLNLTLYAGILKGKKFDLVLQKATEIGVSRIVPVVTERTVPVISGRENKKSRWEKIVSEAFKQCMRRDIPVLEDAVDFEGAVSDCSSEIKMIAHPDERGTNIKKYLAGKDKLEDVSILIGPEGGFTDKEIELAGKNNWDQIVFGFTSLRAETASIVLPAIIIYEWSNICEDKG